MELRSETLKRTTLILVTSLVACQANAADWKSHPNIGAQGVQGAFATSEQYGSFDLQFGCSARKGQNRTIFMVLKTAPDAPIEPGNETSFPVKMLYSFSDGSTSSSNILVRWVRDDHATNVWNSSFKMDKKFLRNFAKSKTLQLIYGKNGLIYTYPMRGSSAAAKTLIEFCYSSNHS